MEGGFIAHFSKRRRLETHAQNQFSSTKKHLIRISLQDTYSLGKQLWLLYTHFIRSTLQTLNSPMALQNFQSFQNGPKGHSGSWKIWLAAAATCGCCPKKMISFCEFCEVPLRSIIRGMSFKNLCN